jgi:hypothetical protein
MYKIILSAMLVALVAWVLNTVVNGAIALAAELGGGLKEAAIIAAPFSVILVLVVAKGVQDILHD